jgi:acetyl esterase/lipase
VEDCKCAVRWLRAHALTFGVDPDRIGVWGGSAGGHLILMVACADENAGLEGSGGWQHHSSCVKAACSYWGPTDFVSWFENKSPGGDERSAEVQFLGDNYNEIPEIYRSASPISHITGDDPPLLLVHSELDPVVPYSQSQLMYQAYIEAGLKAKLIKISGAGHGFRQMTWKPIAPSREEVEQEVLDFLLKELVNTG